MRDVRYISSDGEVFYLTTQDMAGWSNELLGWSWDADSTSGAVKRKARSYKLDVISHSADKLTRFSRAVEQDALNNVQGSMYVDGWALKCNVTVAEPSLDNGAVILVTLTLYATDPTWRRITKHPLVAESGTDTSTMGLDYPTDYEFDYSGTSRGSSMQSFHADVPCSVRVTFFGPCQNPYVQVTSTSEKTTTSNYYGVDASADAGERIVVDPMGRRSVGSSVYKVGAYGERTNLFDSRRRGVEGSGSYVFATMPAGDLMVSWPQGYAVDVETIEERGSLPWS